MSYFGYKSSLATDIGLNNSTKYNFHLVEYDLNSVKKLLVNSMFLVTLINQWACLGISIVVCSSQVSLLIKNNDYLTPLLMCIVLFSMMVHSCWT